MTTELLNVPLELRFVDDGPGYLEGIIVPYNEVTYVAPGQPRGERFLPGAFGKFLTARDNARSVRLVDSHLDGTQRRPYGVATDLEERDQNGLWGKFRFYNTDAGQAGRREVIEGTYGGLSLGFRVMRDRRAADGVRDIVDAQLHHVALVDEPAYEGSKILAVRRAEPPVRPTVLDWTPPEIREFPDPFG
jgi:HK97 family phage prohead protease